MNMPGPWITAGRSGLLHGAAQMVILHMRGMDRMKKSTVTEESIAARHWSPIINIHATTESVLGWKTTFCSVLFQKKEKMSAVWSVRRMIVYVYVNIVLFV